MAPKTPTDECIMAAILRRQPRGKVKPPWRAGTYAEVAAACGVSILRVAQAVRVDG